MLVDFYFLYQKQEGIKSGYFLVESSDYYEPFHAHLFSRGKMAGKVGFYKSTPPVHAHSSRQPSFTLSGVASNRISGIFFPDIHHSNKGFGDVQGTRDILLVEELQNTLKIFVLKEKKNVSSDLVQRWLDGDLNDEISELIQLVKPDFGSTT